MEDHINIEPFNSYKRYYFFRRKMGCDHCFGINKMYQYCRLGYKLYIKSNIEICIDYIINKNEYYLYFINDNQTDNIIGSDKIKDPFINGKVKLDFNNFDYLFALTSKRCNCENRDGFEFRVSFS